MRVLIYVRLTCVVTLLLGVAEGSNNAQQGKQRVRKWGLGRKEVVEFKGIPFSPVGAFNPHFWVDKGERSTSKKYTLWEQSDVYIVEWPGNITKLDKAAPLLKWTKSRAKIRINYCYEYWNAMEMRAYAYKYLHLTWGFNRLTMSSTQPLTIPGDLLYNQGYEMKPNRRIVVPVTDFEFLDDSLLITTAKEGAVIIVYGLGMAHGHLKSGKGPLYPLRYAVAKGITSFVNKLVTPSCCAKPHGDFCPHASTVIAYREYSSNSKIFVSVDGGLNFKKLDLKLEKSSSIIHSVLSFPEQGAKGKILVLHGDENSASLDSYSMSTGTLISSSSRKSAQGNMQLNGIRGMLQASRIGEEMSVIIWDQCNVWYSPFEGKNLTRAVFYVHGYIINPEKYENDSRHYLMGQFCGFGPDSSLAIGKTGKLGLLNSNNIFFFGIDTKSSQFQLAATQLDMSLIFPRHSLSVVPTFDLSQSPKLLYPPRYLDGVPDKLTLKDYSKRLGMRLLPKTVFLSEFITVFYEENARLPKKFKNFALRPCQTSSISVNRSITQKPKYYTFSPLTSLNFTVVFKSLISDTRQLNYEPKDASKYLEIQRRLRSVDETTDNQYIFTYDVAIKSRPWTKGSKTFLINFYTKKDFRCIVQPSYPVHIRIDQAHTDANESTQDEQMYKSKFLTTESRPKEYGKLYSATVCPNCIGGLAGEQCSKPF